MSIMKDAFPIILTTPPFSIKDNFGALDFIGQYGPPLSLLYLAATLEKAGMETTIADFSYERKTLYECARHIVSLQPRCVGIAVHFTFLVDKSLELATLIKELNPCITIIAGGVHFTALPEETMRACPAIDVGILGEGEESLLEIIRCIKERNSLESVNGIIFRQGDTLCKSGKQKLVEDINQLPLPHFGKIDMSAYSLALFKERKKINFSIATSRGCPFGCTFCDRSVLGKRVRFFTINYLSEMIDQLVKEFHVDYLDIEDENICITEDRLRQISGLLEEKHRRFNTTWGCSMRADAVKVNTGRLLYKSGCRNVSFGIESGSTRMLRIYNKELDLAILPGVCASIVKSGIALAGSFIIGGPDEDEVSIDETSNLIKKIDLNFLYLWYFTPFPGSKIYTDIEKSGSIIGSYANRSGQHISFIPRTLSREQLENGYKRIYRSFYSKPSAVLGVLRKYGWRGVGRFCRDGVMYSGRFLFGDR